MAVSPDETSLIMRGDTYAKWGKSPFAVRKTSPILRCLIGEVKRRIEVIAILKTNSDRRAESSLRGGEKSIGIDHEARVSELGHSLCILWK